VVVAELPHRARLAETGLPQQLGVLPHGQAVVPAVREGSPRAVVAQVDGPRWLSLEGVPVVSDDPDRVAEAVRRYGERYRVPGVNLQRVVVEIAVDRVLGRG